MAPRAGGSGNLPGQTLGVALTSGLVRRGRREWLTSAPGRALQTSPGPVQGLVISPPGLRPADPEAGARILGGSWVLAGAAMQTGPGGDPWDRPSPHRRFAEVLHQFTWLPDLLTQGAAGRSEGLRLYLEWRRLFGHWNAFAWDPQVLERRLFHLACGARAICERGSEAETLMVARDLVRQGRFLLASIEGPERAAEAAAVAALAGAVTLGDGGVRLRERALARLAQALPVSVEPDGGHASRSPEAALELLFDLRTLDEALALRGLPAPDELGRAIDRLTGAIWFLTLADGALPAFQGGDESRREYVAAADAGVADETGAVPARPASRNGYHRLESARLQVLVDAAAPASGAFSRTACGQPLALEVLVDGIRLITNCGWSPAAAGPQALRLIDAGSCASLAEQTCGDVLEGAAAALLGPRLIDGSGTVRVDRREAEEGIWLEVSHDGWASRYGLRHSRRIYVDRLRHELRGEDAFVPVGPPPADPARARRFISLSVCFHAHPHARASLAMDRRSVLLRPDQAQSGWWLRNDASEVTLEPSVHYVGGLPRRAQRIMLRSQIRLDEGGRMRWKLARAEPGGGSV